MNMKKSIVIFIAAVAFVALPQQTPAAQGITQSAWETYSTPEAADGGQTLAALSRLTCTFIGLGDDNKTINVKNSWGRNLAYPLKASVTVTINNQTASPEDLIYGQEISLTLSGGKVSGIKGATTTIAPYIESYIPDSSQVIEGQVSDVSSSGKKLTLSAAGGRLTLDLDQYTKVTRRGVLVPASSIQVGDKVLAYLEKGGASGDSVTRVEIAGENNSRVNVFKGYIQAVYPIENKVVLRDAEEYFFGGWYPEEDTLTINLASGAQIYLDGEAVDLREMAETGLGLELYAAVSDNGNGIRGLKVSAQSGPGEMYNSTVDEVDWSAGAIYLDDGSGAIGPGTIALHNGKLMDAVDIQENVHVFMETNLSDDTHFGTFIAWEDFDPDDYEIARGELGDVDDDEFELEDYSRFQDNIWDDEEDDEDMDLSPEAYIIDARDRNNPDTVSPGDFRYTEYSEDYKNCQVITVSDEGLVQGMIILDESFRGDKASVARIESVSGSSMSLEREMDWSEATDRWKENSFPALLDTGYALVYKDGERVSKGMLHPGDKIYVIHDGRGAYIIFIQ